MSVSVPELNHGGLAINFILGPDAIPIAIDNHMGEFQIISMMAIDGKQHLSVRGTDGRIMGQESGALCVYFLAVFFVDESTVYFIDLFLA